MVVTRRTPVAPPPPASRTASSQPIQRAAKGKAPQTTSDASDSPGLHANGESGAIHTGSDSKSAANDANDTPSKKGKNKLKQKKRGRRTNKSRGFFDFASRLLTLWFVIYTLSVCPTDENLQSPVCRGLSNYRKFILEPFILPPIQAALAHPYVSPYVERTQPHIERVVSVATPIVMRTRAEWNARVVPQWNKRVIPTWNKRVVPIWNSRVVPHIRQLEKEIEPYRSRVEQEYTHRVAPYVKLAGYNLLRFRRKAQPYIVLAASKTYKGYQTAKPYAIPLSRRIQALAKRLLLAVQVQRRQFVDPHVARMWDKVKELSSGKPKTSISSPTPSTPSIVDELPTSPTAEPSPSIVSVIQSIVSPNLADSGPMTEVSQTQPLVSPGDAGSSSGVDGPTFIDKDALTSTSTLIPDAVESTLATSFTESPTSIQTLKSASSVLSVSVRDNISGASSLVSSFTEEIKSSASPSLASPSLKVTGPSIVFHPSTTPTPIPSTSSDEEDGEIDLEAFYAELGLDYQSPDAHSESLESLASPPLQTETEQEKAERKRLQAIETAQKRKNIEKRHKQWEDNLVSLIKAKKKELRRNLVSLRKPAAAELKAHVEIRSQIEGLVAEAEKYLKGAELYLKNLKKEGRKPEDKFTLWERVVEKVEAKFEERLKETEGVVNSWYKLVHDREVDEVHKVSQEVKELAQKAQADIGMDYAWLDDVTYDDWQRYHDLMTRSENFTDQARSIQNGSHPSPPVNPVLLGIDDLESEVQDIVMGFETRLRRIKRSGERAFGSAPADDIDDEDTSVEPEVSILPAPAEDSQATAEKDIPPVVIGRSKEEVLEALGKVDPHAATETSKLGANQKESNEIVGSLVRDEVEADLPTSPSSTPHVEL